MTDFKGGGIPTPDLDKDDINFISEKTEFYDDVFVYGKLYADLGGDVQTFSTAGVERVRITKEGDVAIGSENPNVVVESSNTSILAVGIVTAREELLKVQLTLVLRMIRYPKEILRQKLLIRGQMVSLK